jgi:hypothetical protein
MIKVEEISLLIAIPCYGGNLTSETVAGLYKLTKHLERVGIFNELLLLSNQSLIPAARATIANVFINDTNHTHLLMLDADVGFTAESVIKLFELEVDYACAAYPIKTIPNKYNFTISDKEFNDSHTAISVDSIGAGFNLVTRNVFEKIAKVFIDLKYFPTDNTIGYNISQERYNNSYAYFETYIDSNKQQVSEDFAFCNRWRQTGGKIWMVTDVALTHTGSYVFQGQNFANFK